MNKERKCERCHTITRNPKFCSSNCFGLHKRETWIKKWEMNSSFGTSKAGIKEFLRQYLLEEADWKCSDCGWNEINPSTGKVPLSVEHIDGDCQNNVRSNLKVLCPNCHSLTSTYGGLNNGKSTRYRYGVAK